MASDSARRTCKAESADTGPEMTPEQRRLRAQIAANTRWSQPMARADQAEAARSALYARLEREVDPDGKLSPYERAALVRAAARGMSARMHAAKARIRLRDNACREA